jgi:protein associated with RNAse G/E
MKPMQIPMTIIKCGPDGQEKWRWAAEPLEHTAERVRVSAVFNLEDRVSDGVAWKRGDRYIEDYYFARGYNIFDVYDRDTGLRKAWYCNLTRLPRLSEPEPGALVLAYDDLELDLLILPDGTAHVLDEDDFAAAQAAGHITPGEAAQVRADLAALVALAAERAGPFADGPSAS